MREAFIRSIEGHAEAPSPGLAQAAGAGADGGAFGAAAAARGHQVGAGDAVQGELRPPLLAAAFPLGGTPFRHRWDVTGDSDDAALRQQIAEGSGANAVGGGRSRTGRGQQRGRAKGCDRSTAPTGLPPPHRASG